MRNFDFTTDAAKSRVRARYRAEARFKLYGLVAIGLTGLFLVLVLSDILVRGLPAFFQHRLVLDVNVDPAEIDPQNTRDPAVLRGGDFQAAGAQRAARHVPRRARPRGPAASSTASCRAAAPTGCAIGWLPIRSWWDRPIKVPVLLSDDADLYYKGTGTRITEHPGRGTATPSGTSGDITITSSAGDFAPDLSTVKQSLSVQARAMRREADSLRQVVRRIEARKAELERTLALGSSPTVQADLNNITSEIQSLSQKVKQFDDDAAALQARFDASAADEPLDTSVPSLLVAINGGLVKITQLGSASVNGTVLLPLESDAAAAPGTWKVVTYATPEANRRVSDREVAWLERLKQQGLVERAFNWSFFTSGDSREPELAGIRGALVGSALTLLVTLLICLPLGVAAAIYLEEFAPKNRVTELIEVNINNLAAVPSIVFGLLGLAVFLNFVGLPRSAPLVGGLVLALLVLPTIIIASRAALKAVPPSIKEAALGVGASQQQAIFHHVLPLAMPGIMTGTIIGMAHALGETAPLLMIGMVAFIVEVPGGLTDAATVLPVQIYLWSDLPEIAFQAKTAAAIIVLLLFLFVMNGAAIFLRKKFERRW